MLKLFSLACLVLFSSVLSCAADVAPTDTADHGPAPSDQPAERQIFEVQLSRDLTAETVIPAIVAAGHAELAAACESTPGAALRILNPLASGSYEDVPCAAILEDEETAKTRAAPMSPADGPIGQTQQTLGPITLIGCGLFVAGSFLFLNEVLCPAAKTPKAREDCSRLSNFGSAGMTILCAIPF